MRFPFKESDTKKTAKKAFTQSFAVSVICILLCLVALCSTSWAWFSGNAASTENKIVAATCNVAVTVTDSTGSPPETNVGGLYALTKNEVYTVDISAEGTARSSYCIVSVGDARYYTVQISTAAPYNTMRFTLSFSADTEIAVSPHWGTSSRADRDLASGKSYLDMSEKITLD